MSHELPSLPRRQAGPFSTPELFEAERRRHIDGFADSFIIAARRERWRTFLLDPRKRAKITDRLNHQVDDDLIAGHIVLTPPKFDPKTSAYIVADQVEDFEFDDRFVDVDEALRIIENAVFGIVASIQPGVLAALRMEAPAPLIWLHKPPSR